jgi:hypothetical protein
MTSGLDIYRSANRRKPNGAQYLLCEQRRMDKAAVETAKWAKWQFIALIVAVLVAIVAVLVAIVALYAAFEANTIARDSAERQVRAYIGVVTGRVDWIDDRPFAKLTIKNTGQSPAQDYANGRW